MLYCGEKVTMIKLRIEKAKLSNVRLLSSSTIEQTMELNGKRDA